MNLRFTLIAALLAVFSISMQAQSVPQGFNYQSVVRDANGTPYTNQNITLLFAVRSGSANGPVIYTERHQSTSDEYGLVNLIVGQGTVLQGDFTTINWGGGPKYLSVSVETSPNVFDELGSTQLMSVPFALYSLNSGSGGGGGGDNWGTQSAQTDATMKGNGTGGNPLGLAQQDAQIGQVLKWSGTNWIPQDDISNTGTNGGTVTQINTTNGVVGGPITTSGTIGLSNTGVTPGAYGSSSQIPVISVDAQGRVTSVFTVVPSPGTIGINGGSGIAVQQNGTNFTITNTGDTNASDDITTSSQASGDISGPFSNLQINPNTIGTAEITNGSVGTGDLATGAVTAAILANGAVTSAKLSNMGATTGQVLKWSGTAWVPSAESSGLNLNGGTGITISGVSPNLTISNSGDTNAADDLTITSTAGGDVSGVFSNLQIKANAVGTPEIAASAVTGAKIDAMGANSGQVLKWNGTTWAPANDVSGSVTILPGFGIQVITNGPGSYTIANDGDIDPLDDITINSMAGGDISGPFSNLQIKTGAVGINELANNSVGTANIINGSITAVDLDDMNAAIGQVMSWNGTTWVPTTLSGGGTGDNWGSQVAQTNATLQGNGTNGAPLGLAAQSATSGQVLKFNGTTWVPADDIAGNGDVYTEGTGIDITGTSPNFVINNTGDLSGTNEIQALSLTGNNLSLSIGGGTVTIDPSATNELQTLSLVGNALSLSNNGGIVTVDASTTNELQTISLSGNTLTLSNGGGSVNLPGGGAGGDVYASGTGIDITGTSPNFVINNTGDLSATNEIQALSLTGNTLSLSNGGGMVVLPGGGSTYTAGAGIAINGVAPNQTIANTGDLSNTNELQTISLTGNALSLSNGGGLVTIDPSATNEIQSLSLTGSTLSLSNGGGMVVLPSGNTYTGGTGISVTGSAPNFTINNTGDPSILNELQLLSLNGSKLKLSLTNSQVDFDTLFTNGGLGLWKSAGNNIYNNNTGNVGINTLTPKTKLHVVGGGETVRVEGQNPLLSFSNSSTGIDGFLWQRSGAFVMGTQDSSQIVIQTGSTNPSITVGGTNGNVLIGAGTPGAEKLKVVHGSRGFMLENETGFNWEFWVADGNGTLNLYNNSGGVGPGGPPVGAFALNGTYMSSDRRLKKSINEIPSVLSKLNQLKPVTYRFKSQADDADLSIGVIAQDVQALFPELVTKSPVRDGQGGTLMVNYTGLSVLTLKAIQEQQTQIDTLKTENAELRARLDAIEAKLRD